MKKYLHFNRHQERKQTKNEDIIFTEYKKLVGAESDIKKVFDLCLNEHIISNQGKNLQIIDMGGGDGLFAMTIKKRLPKSKILSIDLSETMISLGEKDYQGIELIHDDLMNFEHYIDKDKKTLIVCRGTLHHLKSNNIVLLFEKFKTQSYGLFIKDLLRVKEEEIDRNSKKVIRLAKDIDKKSITFQETIMKLTQKSIRSSLSADEFKQLIQDGNIHSQYNKEKSYIELYRRI